jgi:hypothetical protein|tara:strand:+ start:851 stop:1036 length:186 start_codon:yes stop_codon:yes gene_type:complete
MSVDDSIKIARHYLRLGNEQAYQTEMISLLKTSYGDDKEFIIKQGKRDGFSFRQFGLRVIP